jgi:hypothetical protein
MYPGPLLIGKLMWQAVQFRKLGGSPQRLSGGPLEKPSARFGRVKTVKRSARRRMFCEILEFMFVSD